MIITEWDQFRALDLDRVKLLMRAPVRGRPAQHLPPAEMRARGFRYTSVGRP